MPTGATSLTVRFRRATPCHNMSDDTAKLCKLAANGNAEAESFLRTYLGVAHDIDDIIDERPSPEFVVKAFIKLLTLTSSSPFYCQWRDYLFPLLAISLSRYATSVQWEQSNVEHQRR